MQIKDFLPCSQIRGMENVKAYVSKGFRENRHKAVDQLQSPISAHGARNSFEWSGR